ncbi:MATE family efflux transporter [Allopusillimonas soli]|uniref:Multidrug-efflux transporter n=1 Tax=Allopusillimonas soli TaxID=659016 RepID=A0A853F5L2_9BURK|nr:MATE family efflux transporter [Allopusillimonas soli]NYT35393.1 MATE family efflux transporter [Allopusillimonas soli]TEA75809.1 MATE family efflux transporter [Allopusillimonas soli]
MPPDQHALWKREAAATLRLGLPLVLTNLAQIAMTVTDVVFIGRLGPKALAAATLGANLYMAIAFFAMGLVSATAPMAARELGAGGAGAMRDVQLTVRQGLWSAAILSLAGCMALWHGEAILLAMRQPPELASMAGTYLRGLLWAMPSFLGYLVLRSFVSALERPRSALFAAFAGILFNVFANWVLIYGNLGFPALGLIGAGIASASATFALLLIMSIIVQVEPGLRRYRVFSELWRSDWPRLRAFWRLGLPIAITTAFEVTIFNAAAFLIGWLGAVALAAHSIAIQIASVSFMVPYGIAQAATVRVGLALGAGNRNAISRAGWTAFALGTGFMAMSAVVMITAPRLLIGLFLDLADPVNAPVVVTASALLAVAALFQVVDAGQVLGAGMLRGLHDTRIPMIYAGLGYWGVGLPSGAALAFWAGWGSVGIWCGLAIGLSVVAVLMTHRWAHRDRLHLVPAALR